MMLMDQAQPVGNRSRQILLMQVLFAFFCALVVRIYIWKHFPHVIFQHEADGVGYIGIAREILENGSIGRAVHFPPFYPAVIALCAALSGSYESGARLASVLAGSMAVVPFHLACRYLLSGRGALYAALVAALFGPFIDYAVQPISQATYLCLIAAGVWFGLRLAATVSIRYAAAFGLISAAMYLTRPEGILFFVINVPVLVWCIIRADVALRRKLKVASALCCSFGVPVLLYLFRLRDITGGWTLSGKSAATIIGIDASMRLLPNGKTYAEATAAGTGLATLVPSLSALLTTITGQAARFGLATYALLPGFAMAIAAMGLFLIWAAVPRAGRGERQAAFIGRYLFFSPLLMLLPVFAFDKISLSAGYIFPFFPVFIACFAQGAVWLEEQVAVFVTHRLPLLRGIVRFLPLGAAAVACLMLLSFNQFYSEVSSEEYSFMTGQQDFLLRQTGHWLRANTPSDAGVMARWSNIGFYADRPWTGLADGTIAQVVEYAKRAHMKYIVIDSDAVPRRRPQLNALLFPDTPQPGLTPVYGREDWLTRVVVYRVE